MNSPMEHKAGWKKIILKFFRIDFIYVNFGLIYEKIFSSSVIYPIFAIMKITACLFLLLFVGFLLAPTVITMIDKTVDVTMAFTANEEESSSKHTIGLEYIVHIYHPNAISLQFLHEQAALNHSYKDGDRLVILDVLSPPPKQV